MKPSLRFVLATCAIALPLTSRADTLPPRLAGSWGTSASLFDGNTLTLQPFAMPGAPADEAERAARVSMSCRYEAAGPTLTCTDKP